MKKVIIFGALGALILISLLTNYINTKASAEREVLVEQYIECLYKNGGQRYYCAQTLNQNYMIMDQYAEDYGYTFSISNAGNLIIERNN